MSGVAGIAVEPSGAIWPYRMITTMFSHLINTYPTRLSIETGTPALSIIYSPGSSHPYEITTPRGTIKAKQLVHCTNGYTGHLLPGLRGKIWPCKGHMSVQVPGEKFPRKGDRSWSVVYDTLGLDYVTQNVSTGELWYGGGLIRGKDAGLSAFGDSNDEVMDTMTRVHLHGAGPVFYGKENWGEEKGGEGRVKAEWSGIMGFTADGLPLVGNLPEIVTGRQGEREWICGGFNGYGMPNCWGSGKALADLMVLGKIGDDFPESYLVNQARLDGMKGENAVEVFFGSE
jgi:glycine/D-amino acid oxidase-like deaminating enzyme